MNSEQATSPCELSAFWGSMSFSSLGQPIICGPDDPTSPVKLVGDNEVGDDLALVDGTQRQKARLGLRRRLV